jgi:hypothetical protein
MVASNIDIKILAEFLGKNAFKQADTAVNKLNKTVKSLGQSFGIAFGGAALGYAVKSSIKAFADAEKETVVLTNTVKNLGLAFDAPAVSNYVDQIGRLYGVTGAQAVPAMQALLTATGSVAKSTQIMNVALDLAASRNADVATVASDLSNAYVGNTKSLAQYRLGLTKAELASMTFDQILSKISKETMGAADEAAMGLSGQLAILGEAANRAKARIGGGLFEALGGVAGPNGAGGAAASIENLSIKLTNTITGFGYLVQEVKIAQPILVAAGIAIGLAWAPWFTAISLGVVALGALGNAMKKNNAITPPNNGPLFFPTSGDGGYKKREAARKKAENEAIARNKQLAKLVKDQAKSAAEALKAKQLQNAIDKANLALGKGADVFDLDKIQIAAALANQAEALGKATSASQVIQIANDVARLNVKRDILALEDAIASQDEAAIIRATAKLNEDLKILNALSGQKNQLALINSILSGLESTDLINQANLDEALRKIKEMAALIASMSCGGLGGTGTNPVVKKPKSGISPDTPPRSLGEVNKAVEDLGGVISVIGSNGKEFIKLVDSLPQVYQGLEDSVAKNMFIKNGILTQPFNAGSFRTAEGGSTFNSSSTGAYDRGGTTVNVTVTGSLVAQQDLVQVVQNAVQENNRYGNNLSVAGSIS